MEREHRESTSKVDMVGMAGPIWAIGWMFTLGYLHLTILEALIAVLLWPYYLGAALG